MTEELNQLISIVIPTRNEEKRLLRLLRSIKKQNYKNYEILIADYKSSDKTLEIARKYGCKIIRVKRRGIARAKNAAMRRAKGDIVAFIDADCVLPKRDLLKNVLTAFKQNQNVVIIQVTPTVNKKEISKSRRRNLFITLNWIERTLLRFFIAVGAPFFAVCVFCRADTLRKVGKFNPNLHLDEDHEFYLKFGRYGKPLLIDDEFEESYRRLIKLGLLRTFTKYLSGTISVFLLAKKSYITHQEAVR
jgi:glycosyltransferase involved in cell wall biosynthesis